MINLLSEPLKREIKAGRKNVILAHYASLILGSVVFLAIIFGIGYFITSSERAAAESELTQRKQEAIAYHQTQKHAEDFSKNLASAKIILSNEIEYSSLLIGIASAMPKDTILSNLALDNTSLNGNKPIVLSAEAKSYNAALQLKTSLETSPLFEKVNIATVSEKANAPGQPSPTYPLTVSINASITKSALQNTGGNNR